MLESLGPSLHEKLKMKMKMLVQAVWNAAIAIFSSIKYTILCFLLKMGKKMQANVCHLSSIIAVEYLSCNL